MKIAIIGNYAPSAINFYGVLIEELKRRGHDLLLIMPGEGSGELSAWAEERGVRFLTYSLRRTGVNPFYECITIFALLRALRSFAPDLILTYTIKPNAYGAIASRLLGIRQRCTVIAGLGSVFIKDSPVPSTAKKLAKILLKFGVRSASKVVFCNHSDRRELEEASFVGSRSKVLVLPVTGVDLQAFSPAPPVVKPLRFIFIGRLVKDKGIFEFMQAAAIMKREHPETEFEVIGDIDVNPSSATQEQVSKWKSEGLAFFRGFVPDVRPYLRDASVFVLPSYREGCSKALMEAMAMARPVVTTDAPGCGEFISNGLSGFIVPAGQVDPLVNALKKFVLDPTLIVRMGSASELQAREQFDARQISLRLSDFLEASEVR